MVYVYKTVKLDEETYELLNKAVGEMTICEKRPVSMSETLHRILEKKKGNIMDFAGSWKMSDAETKRMKNGLKRAWASWRPRSF